MRSSTRISVLSFTIIVSSSIFVNVQGMKSSSYEKSLKKDIIRSDTYHVSRSIRYETQIKSDDKQKLDFHNTNAVVASSPNVKDECEIIIDNKSKAVFQKILKHHDPRFVQFHIKLSKPIGSKKDVFQPGRWYWTYGTVSRPYQFLSWHLHYGIYTFGLLDHKTSLVPFVKLKLHGYCNLTLGTEDTSELITDALVPVVNFTSAVYMPHKYTENYFCYLAVRDDVRSSLSYYVSIYLLYPIIFINYKCCLLKYNFTDQTFRNNCSQNVLQTRKWTNVINFNIILGVVIIAYCPVLLFRIFAWLGESDETDNDEHGIELIQDISGPDEDNDNEDWIFANGQSPLTFSDVLSFKGIGIDKRWPVLVSRLRRFICLLLAPSVIYIEMLMSSRGIGVWKQGDKIAIKDFVEVGTPVGFLSFFGDSSNRNKVFAPAFGGPIGISVLYFILGFTYLVLPKCLKKIVENGLPYSDLLNSGGILSNLTVIKSPLFFGTKDVIKLSQINVNHADLEPGYSKGVTLMKCNFYMLFTMQFWRQVCHIQTGRVSCFTENMSLLKYLLSVFYLPVYVVFCSFEVLLCILYFGIPLIFFMAVMVRGAMKMIPYLKETNALFSYLFSVRFTRGLGAAAIFATIVLFTYCVFLIVVSSLKFISHVITYCFVAVIIYPSVSFGSLFLVLVIAYYIIRQLKFFSYKYTMLLNTAVEITKHINKTPNHVTCYEGHFLLSNVGFHSLREIEINGRLLDSSQIIVMSRTNDTVKTKMKDNCYGIPKDLFDSLIQKYRPVHIHVLSLLFRVFILIGCVLFFLSITHSCIIVPEGQISEVMHVVFIIVVGALPKLIETNFIGHNNAPIEKIEKRYLEQSIVEYWTQRDRSIIN
ncbi:uncharacterized protein LOC128557753 [Mercenaria mercenaria]|uniref:uncharacterized protein LOC128557753 n=1 Tax=Mercenaria mercenaria TaxID=6596 RepID=UPI00234EAD44|nr:uncharacterized protein LOC128557753 [Mercenaria mercenaria]